MAPGQDEKKPDGRKAVAYVRVAAAGHHVGPEAQRASIEAWAAHEGISVVAWHTDHGVSGRSNVDQRPALIAALEQVRADGAGILVVATRDRFTRDVHIAVGIERQVARLGAHVVSADGFMRT